MNPSLAVRRQQRLSWARQEKGNMDSAPYSPPQVPAVLPVPLPVHSSTHSQNPAHMLLLPITFTAHCLLLPTIPSRIIQQAAQKQTNCSLSPKMCSNNLCKITRVLALCSFHSPNTLPCTMQTRFVSSLLALDDLPTNIVSAGATRRQLDSLQRATGQEEEHAGTSVSIFRK